MVEKPASLASSVAEAFQDKSVVEAYRYRLPYPADVFTILADLVKTQPMKRVLDAGCGTGSLARYLVEHVEHIDAVDFSHHMLEEGQRLPNGNHPRLRWLYGCVEEVALQPPYALVMAGASLHWMNWNVVLPRFREVLVPGGYLALVSHHTLPNPWSLAGEDILARYRTDGGYQPYDMVGALEQHGLFQRVGEKTTAPISFEQSIDDYIASYYSRAILSRERLGAARANDFDQEIRERLLTAYPDGRITFRIAGHVLWGLPMPS